MGTHTIYRGVARISHNLPEGSKVDAVALIDGASHLGDLSFDDRGWFLDATQVDPGARGTLRMTGTDPSGQQWSGTVEVAVSEDSGDRDILFTCEPVDAQAEPASVDDVAAEDPAAAAGDESVVDGQAVGHNPGAVPGDERIAGASPAEPAATGDDQA